MDVLSTLIVRPRAPADSAFIATLSQEAFLRFAQRPARAVRHMVLDPRARSFIAEVDGERCGMAVMSQETVARGTMMRLDAIAVVRALRGRGVGRQLLERVIADAQAHGAEGISLMTATGNRAARGLFAAMGFMVIATKLDAYRGGLRAVLMLKPLQIP